MDEFEDCEEEEDSSGSFDVRQSDPDRVALYTLSSTSDEDLTLEYSSDGSGPGGSFYGNQDSFDFTSYLSHYSNPQFYPGVDPSGQQTGDENFWLHSILGSEDFFVSSSDCPFDFSTQNVGNDMPTWLTSSQVYGAYTDEGEGGSDEQRVEQEDHEEQEMDDDGHLGYYEREGHVSRMGDYGDENAGWENEEEEEEDDDGGDSRANEEERDEEEAGSAESAESDQMVAMETDSTDDNLDEVGSDPTKPDNVPNGRVDLSPSSLVNCNNFSHPPHHQRRDVVSPIQTNGLKSPSVVDTNGEWKNSSVMRREPSTGTDVIENLSGSRVESAA